MMILPITSYSNNLPLYTVKRNTNVKFEAKPQLTRQTKVVKEPILKQAKEILSELFPFFDPAYKKLMKKQIVQDKPFRVPVSDINVYGYKEPGRYMYEYDTPDAEKIYKQLKKTQDKEEIIRLHKQLGTPKVVDVEWEERLDRIKKGEIL